MLKSTPPAATANRNSTSSSSTCLKNANSAAIAAKNVAPVKATTPCTKNVPSKNIAVAPSPKSVTCTKSTTATTTCKSANCTKGALNGETTSSTFSIPAGIVVPKSPPGSGLVWKVPVTSCTKNGATNSTTNSNCTSLSTTTNGTNTATTNGNSIPAPPPKVENTELRIIIIDENWSQYCYRIKINTPFGKLINRFCQQVRKIDHKSVLFWYHGRLVEDEDTPKTLNIKDGEVILAHYIK